MNFANRIFKGILLVAVFGLIVWLGIAIKGGQQKELGQANLLVAGGPGNLLLANATSCQGRTDASLSVAGGGDVKDWYAENIRDDNTVNPTKYAVLSGRNAAGAMVTADPATGKLGGVGDTVIFTAPRGITLISNHFRVNAVDGGDLPAEPWVGGTTFDVYISPPCVTKLEFIDPNPNNPVSADPQTSSVTLHKIRATFSNGTTYDYTDAQIANLPIAIDVNPATGVRLAGNVITLPQRHSNITVNLVAGENNLTPVYRDGQAVTRASGFVLESDKVDPESLVVYILKADGTLGDFLAQGIDYQFNEGAGTAHDFLTVTNPDPLAIPGLSVSYSFRNAGATLSADRPLTIAANSCEELQADIFQGRGQGFAEGVAATGSKSVPFDFTAGQADDQVIVTNNPAAGSSSFGTSAFQLTFNLAVTLPDRAVVTAHTNYNYEISVKKGAAPAETASNFAYAVNSLIPNGPVIAYVTQADNKKVELHSVEVGAHTNSYTCTVDGVAVANCFAGGLSPAGAERVVDPPRPLEPTMYRNEVRTVYSRGGNGNYAWRSSNSDVIEVKALADQRSDRELLNNSNVLLSQALQNSGGNRFLVPAAGRGTAGNCELEGVAPNQTIKACDVTISTPITYNIDGETYPITLVYPPPAVAPQNPTVQGQGILRGTITGTARITKAAGGTIMARGTLTGNVGGQAIGGVASEVSVTFSIAPNALVQGDISNITTVTATSGTLAKSETLIPTNRDPLATGEAIVTNFAVLKAKTIGTATLFVTDQAGCTAPIDIEVKGEKLTLEPVDYRIGDILEVNDSVQVRALLGFSAEQRTDVTNSAVWTSDNPTVASVTATGRVTALAPGSANITAVYTTQTQGQGTTSVQVVSEGRVTIRVNKVEGLTVTMDQSAISQLPQAARDAVYQNVVLAINSVSAAGKTLMIDGHNITLIVQTPALPYRNNAERIRSMRNWLVNDITLSHPIDGLTATPHQSLLGVLTLSRTSGSAPISISTTANPEELTILPVVSQTITLDRNLTYPAQVVAEYDSGLTKRFTNRGVTWVNTPLNYLDDALLPGGLIKAGELRGTSRVHVTLNNGLREIQSNSLTFEVPNTPYIEYVQIIGNASVVRGATLQMVMKVGDADTIGDLQDIEIFLAKPNAANLTTFDQIFANSQIFTLNTPLDQVQAESAPPPAGGTPPPAGNPPPAGGGGTPPPAGGNPPPGGSGHSFIPAAYATETAQPLSRIFRFPVQIPQMADLTDGTYKLLIQVTDRSGKSVKFVRDIQVGAVASGDVDGNGRTDINDAIAAFRFYTGKAVPTAAQLTAIDSNRNSRVDLLEVITLLRTVMNRT